MWVKTHTTWAKSAQTFAGHLSLWAAVGPALALVLLWLASGPGMAWFVGKYALTGKDFQEFAGPSILIAASLIAVLFAFSQRQPALTWLAALPLLLLCRELHFAGTSGGIWLGLALWGAYGLRQIEELRPWLATRISFGLICGAFGTYLLALALDHGLAKQMPHWQIWSIAAEETLESFGHLQVLIGLIVAGLTRLPMRVPQVGSVDPATLPIRQRAAA